MRNIIFDINISFYILFILLKLCARLVIFIFELITKHSTSKNVNCTHLHLEKHHNIEVVTHDSHRLKKWCMYIIFFQYKNNLRLEYSFRFSFYLKGISFAEMFIITLFQKEKLTTTIYLCICAIWRIYL